MFSISLNGIKIYIKQIIIRIAYHTDGQVYDSDRNNLVFESNTYIKIYTFSQK